MGDSQGLLGHDELGPLDSNEGLISVSTMDKRPRISLVQGTYQAAMAELPHCETARKESFSPCFRGASIEDVES